MGQGSALSRCGPEAGTWRGTRAQGRGGWAGGGHGEGGARRGGSDPRQVQRRSPERSVSTAEPLGAPRPGWADIRAPRSRPPRQRPQIGGAAAPRVAAGPGRLLALPLFPAPRPRPTTPLQLRAREGEGAFFSRCAGREETQVPERARRERAGPARPGPAAAGGERRARALGRWALALGRCARDLCPPGAGRRSLLPRGSSPDERRARIRAKSLPGAAGRLRRQTATLRPTPPPPAAPRAPAAGEGVVEGEGGGHQREREERGI